MSRTLSNGLATRPTSLGGALPVAQRPAPRPKRFDVLTWALLGASVLVVAFAGYSMTLDDGPKKVYYPAIAAEEAPAADKEAVSE